MRTHDKKHILKNIDKSVNFKDITDDFCCLGIFGPKSRELLNQVFGEKFSKDDFKFGRGKKIVIKNIELWFQRISYVGELGWEIYIPTEDAKLVYDLITEFEEKFNLIHAGAHAMDIMRMEKGYLHWGHDISPAENPFEAGLGFAVKMDQSEDFIGKESLVKNKRAKKKQLVMFTLDNSTPGNPLLLHDEPIYYNNKIVGETTSGNYSFNYDKNLTFGYIDSKIDLKTIDLKLFEVEVAKIKYKLTVLTQPLHDPKNLLLKN